MTLARRLSTLRLRHGWTQRELGRRSGIARQATISDIERGSVTDPQFWTLQRLARALGTTPEYLMTGEVEAERGMAFPPPCPSHEGWHPC